jgi:hypothetical protein
VVKLNKLFLETIEIEGREDDVRVCRLTSGLVRKYFSNLWSFSPNGCDRCGVNMGQDYECKRFYRYKGFILCDSCYQDKVKGKAECSPDIEDLLRIGIEGRTT